MYNNDSEISMSEERKRVETEDVAGSKEKPSGKRKQALFLQLEKKVNEKNLFLCSHLSREDLCKLIGVDKNDIAAIVKEFDGRNVPMYINNKRIIYAARLMQRQPNFNVQSIAEECGFNHLGTFYRLFRRKYDMTPIDFEKLVRKNASDDILDEQGDLKQQYRIVENK